MIIDAASSYQCECTESTYKTMNHSGDILECRNGMMKNLVDPVTSLPMSANLKRRIIAKKIEYELIKGRVVFFYLIYCNSKL